MTRPGEKFVFWDFDGTLAFRPGMWASCLAETLEADEPGRGIAADDLRPFLRDGFPWHAPETPHLELSEPEAWWRTVEALLARAFEGVGFAKDRAAELAALAHARYVDCREGWQLFPDTLPALRRLSEHGWRHAILSNHVPELPALVEGLGLAERIEVVVTSAEIGYEKPHPEAFAVALRRCGNPEHAWMVGDNPVADVAGAEAVSIPAVLVRTDDAGVTRRAADLLEAATFIEAAA